MPVQKLLFRNFVSLSLNDKTFTWIVLYPYLSCITFWQHHWQVSSKRHASFIQNALNCCNIGRNQGLQLPESCRDFTIPTYHHPGSDFPETPHRGTHRGQTLNRGHMYAHFYLGEGGRQSDSIIQMSQLYNALEIIHQFQFGVLKQTLKQTRFSTPNWYWYKTILLRKLSNSIIGRTK